MDDLIQQGIALCKVGKLSEARKVFEFATKQNLENINAWSWLYSTCETNPDRIICLKQILRINPKAEIAQLLLYSLTGDDLYNNPKANKPSFRKKLTEIKQLQEKSFLTYKDYVSFVESGAEDYFNYLDITGDINDAMAYANNQYSEALSIRLNEQGVTTQIRLLTSEDEMVCQVCGPADHKLKDQPIDTAIGDWNGQTWGQRFAGPPFHKGCRCKTVVEKV